MFYMKFLNVLVSSAVLIGATPISEALAGLSFFGKTLLPECVCEGKYCRVVFKRVTVPNCRESKECCQWMVEHYDDMVKLSGNWISEDSLLSLLNETHKNTALSPIFVMLMKYTLGKSCRDVCDLTTVIDDIFPDNNEVIERLLHSCDISKEVQNFLFNIPIYLNLVDEENSWILYKGYQLRLSNFKPESLMPVYMVRCLYTSVLNPQNYENGGTHALKKLSSTIDKVKNKI